MNLKACATPIECAAKAFAALCASCALALLAAAAGAGSAWAVTYTEVEVDSFSELEAALAQAAEYATDDEPYKIVVEPGDYTATDTLYISSNTYLYAVSCTFTNGTSSPFLRTGEGWNAIASADGYCYENITVEGGTWDGADNGATAMYFCHAADVVLLDATFENYLNSHIVEIAGVDTMTIEGCTFSNQRIEDDEDLTYEAIQLDILGEDHVHQYAEQDLTISDLAVVDCTFDGVVRGVGNHATVLNNPFIDLEVSGCTFTDIDSCAVQLENVKGCLIEGNDIAAPRGVFVFSYRQSETYLYTELYDESYSGTSTSYKTPSDSAVEISDNTIVVSGSDPWTSYTQAAVYVAGMNLTSASDDSLPLKNYYLTGVEVSGNDITTSGHGVCASDVRSTDIHDNDISCAGSSSSQLRGVAVYDASTSTSVDDNAISKFYRGVYVFGASTAASVSGNTIAASTDSGIYVYNGSTATDVSSNTITSPTKYGIAVSTSSSASTVKDNAIASSGSHGIFVYNSSTATTISGNTVSAAGGSAVIVNTSASATTISSNTITSPTKYGIAVTTSSSATNIKSNSITSSGGHGIFVYNSSSATTISSNTVKKAGSSGIMVSTSSKATTISSNTISSPSVTGIYLYKSSSSSTVSSNSVSSAGKYGIHVYGSTATNVKSSTISSPKSYGIQVASSSKVTTLSSNTVKSGSSKGISITSVKAAMTISSNTVTSCSGYSIFLYPQNTSYKITVKGNTITGKSKGYVGIYASKAQVQAQSNTIKSCSYPLYFTSTVKGYILKNSLSGNSTNKYKIAGSTIGNLSTPTLSVKTKTTTSITLSWTKVSSAKGYQIYRSTSSDGTYSKVKTVTSNSTLSWKNSSLTKSKTYYYKIRSYKVIKNTTVYSSLSSAKAVKTKS